MFSTERFICSINFFNKPLLKVWIAYPITNAINTHFTVSKPPKKNSNTCVTSSSDHGFPSDVLQVACSMDRLFHLALIKKYLLNLVEEFSVLFALKRTE